MARAPAAAAAPEPLADHPRHTASLLGHEGQQRAFLDAYDRGRLHHAWLFAGPRGIGKATMAWRCARLLLSGRAAIVATDVQPPAGPDLFGAPEPASMAAADTPPAGDLFDPLPDDSRITHGSHPDLRVLERPWDDKRKRRRGEIPVDEVRSLAGFLHMTAGAGGRRVVLVDSVDEMNRNAANALLKLLEEPPQGAVLLLVSHTPGGLLPTIRSRCRRLAFDALPQDTAAAIVAARRPGLSHEERDLLCQLAAGSPGVALELADAGGAALHQQILSAVTAPADAAPHAALAIAERVAGSDAERLYPAFCGLVLGIVERAAILGARGETQADRLAPQEGAARQRLLSRALPAQWVETAAALRRLLAQADDLNLDKRQVAAEALTRLRAP